MKATIRNHFAQWLAALAYVLFFSSSALAASINYGDLDDILPGSITFTQVTESSGTDPVPLYGAPVVTVNDLDFDPLGFTSNSAGGGADLTDGQLNFGLVAELGTAFSDVGISENGDFTLFGTGTALTSVAAGLFLQVTITEVDGSPITPITADVSVSDDYDLVANPGLNQAWSLAASIDLDQALIDASQSFILGATKAEVVINNTLVSISEAATVAFIAKKDFMVEVTTEVPEPTTATLALLALGCLGLIASRRLHR